MRKLPSFYANLFNEASPGMKLSSKSRVTCILPCGAKESHGLREFSLLPFPQTDSPKDLISKLLVVDPSRRISVQQALTHDFFQILVRQCPPVCIFLSCHLSSTSCLSVLVLILLLPLLQFPSSFLQSLSYHSLFKVIVSGVPFSSLHLTFLLCQRLLQDVQ